MTDTIYGKGERPPLNPLPLARSVPDLDSRPAALRLPQRATSKLSPCWRTRTTASLAS